MSARYTVRPMADQDLDELDRPHQDEVEILRVVHASRELLALLRHEGLK